MDPYTQFAVIITCLLRKNYAYLRLPSPHRVIQGPLGLWQGDVKDGNIH